jgi:adenylyltransferase/sulfurtransferase
VLGVGGIGCAVSMALVRLGVRRVMLVDCDTVDASNLNRQLLFSQADVGRRKVDAAVAGLAHHNLGTELSAHHLDAVRDWAAVVALAADATLVVNAIDHGQYFDVAVASLCCARGLPYLTAASYAHAAIAEGFTGQPGAPCWVCNNLPPRLDVCRALRPECILALPSLYPLLAGLEQHVSARSVGSSILPCVTAAMVCVCFCV